MAVPTVTSKGLRESFQLYLDAIQMITDINKDTAIIADPSATVKVADRVAAYNEIAQLQNQFAELAKLEGAHSFFATALTKLNTYLAKVPIMVPDIGSGAAMIPLQYQGHDATLLDIVNAINAGDTQQDFTVNAHFNYDTDSVKNTNWLDSGAVKKAINGPDCGGGYDRTNGGVTWGVDKCSGCNRDWSFHAKASVATWEQFASGVQNTDPKSEQAKDLADLSAFLGANTQK
jgi:hypothetical protein